MDIQHPRMVSSNRMQGRPLELEALGSSAVPPSPVFADVRNVGVLPAIPRTAVSLGTLQCSIHACLLYFSIGMSGCSVIPKGQPRGTDS